MKQLKPIELPYEQISRFTASWYHKVWGRQKQLHAGLKHIGKFLNMLCEFVLGTFCLEPCRICFQFIESMPGRRTICNQCWTSKISFQPVCEWFGQENAFGFHIASGVTYTGEVRDLIHRMKYENDPILAKDLSALIVDTWPTLIPLLADHPVVLVPIPLSKKRFASRGYNQAELLCLHAADHLRLQYVHALSRVKETKPQFGLSRLERIMNLQSAFKGNRKQIAGKVVVLIDDIYTSGATLAAAAKEAQACGAIKVFALTLARVEQHRFQEDH